jgi:MYXO-CTERM domain-containing protein
MKKVTKLFGAVAVFSLLTFTTPVVAQDTDNNATTTRSDDADDDDDEGKWGLAGLLGLLGLLGLKRRDDDRNRTTTR